MNLVIIPDLQIPIDLPTFGPLVMQSSWGIHSDVSLQKSEKPGILKKCFEYRNAPSDMFINDYIDTILSGILHI